MPLPQPDPSNPALPAPLFADVDAVRGDHLRANNQLIWENLQYLFDFTGRTTDTLTEGAANLYYTEARAKAAALAAALTGYAVGSDAAIAATDTILQAFDKTQAQINARTIKYAKLSDTQASGTEGGTFTSGAWQTRAINTEDSDSAGIVSISANQFTLQAGTYRFRGEAQVYGVEGHKLKLRNITDSADTLIGLSAYARSPSNVANMATVVGEFTIAGAKTFELQHRCGLTVATFGFGLATSFGVSEVYLTAEIWKIG